MNRAFDCRVVLEFGAHRRVVALADLVAALALHGQEARVFSIFFADTFPHAVHTTPGEGGTTGRMGLSSSEETKNENENRYISSSLPFRDVGEGKESEGNHGGPPSERLAVYLADRLDDWKSYRFFLGIASSVPREVILDALARALDIPRQSILRSRGAYFTKLVRSYLARHRV